MNSEYDEHGLDKYIWECDECGYKSYEFEGVTCPSCGETFYRRRAYWCSVCQKVIGGQKYYQLHLTDHYFGQYDMPDDITKIMVKLGRWETHMEVRIKNCQARDPNYLADLDEDEHATFGEPPC